MNLHPSGAIANVTQKAALLLPKPMPAEARSKLGVYVYMLVDPRDHAVFYVGKGAGNRVYHHQWDVSGEQKLIDSSDRRADTEDTATTTSVKRARIREINAEGLVPEHWIVRHGITADDPDKAAYAIEQALIDGVGLASPNKLTNIMGGHTRTEHGLNRAEELVLRYSAPLRQRCRGRAS